MIRFLYAYDIFGGDGTLLRRFTSTRKKDAYDATVRMFQDDAARLMRLLETGKLPNPKYIAATWKYQGFLQDGLGDRRDPIPVRSV